MIQIQFRKIKNTEDRQTQFQNFPWLHMHILIPKISFNVTVNKTFYYITLSIS